MKISRESIGKFIQYIIFHPLPIDEKKQTVWKTNGHIWCQDWEDTEIMKVFFEGKDVYKILPPSFRAIGNPLFDPSRIMKKADDLLLEVSVIPKDGTDLLIVPSCGRGIRIFLATYVSSFKEVWVYDKNNEYEKLVTGFFPEVKWLSEENYDSSISRDYIIWKDGQIIQGT